VVLNHRVQMSNEHQKLLHNISYIETFALLRLEHLIYVNFSNEETAASRDSMM
jgi:hypothetical protein